MLWHGFITDLGLIFDFHVVGSKNLGINSLGKTQEDIGPRGPDGHSKGERSTDTVDGVPNDIPQESVKLETTGGKVTTGEKKVKEKKPSKYWIQVECQVKTVFFSSTHEE